MSWANLARRFSQERVTHARGGSLPRKYTIIDGVEYSLPDLQRSELNVNGVGMTTLYRRWGKGLRGLALLGVENDD